MEGLTGGSEGIDNVPRFQFGEGPSSIGYIILHNVCTCYIHPL